MKYFLCTSLLALITTATFAADYKIDSHHANARFAIDHFGTSTNIGGFYGLTGNIQYNPQEQTGSVDITIPTDTINSGVERFNQHLKGADLFNTAQYPTMRFQSTKWYFKGDKVRAVAGNLTLLGQTHPVILKATKFNCYQSPILKTEVCGGDFRTAIDRTKWGMDYLVSQGMSKKVIINIQIEAGKVQ